MNTVYTYSTLGEVDNRFYGLCINGVLVEYYTSLQALGAAIEDYKALQFGIYPMTTDIEAV